MEFDVLHDVIEKAGFDDNAQRAATSEFLLSTQFVEDRSFIDNVKFPSNLDPFEKIIVPYGVRSVCLSGAKNVQQIILPDGVTTLEENAFTGNKKLEEIKIPETVEEIGTKAFYGCLSLQEIAIPSSVSKIEENLFADCVLLRKLILSEGVTEIGNEVLVGGRSSASLDYLFIPKTVEEISTDAFYRSSIEIIEYAGTAEEWNRKFTDKVNLDMVGVIKCLDGDIVIQE